MASGLEYRSRALLRWGDIDRLGHLNQAVYHELLAEARMGLLTGLVSQADGDEAFHGWVLARVELNYYAEVRRDHGELQIVARVGHVGTSSLRLDYDVALPDGTVAASGSTVLVAWDPATRGKRLITHAERAALTRPASGRDRGIAPPP
jgi:acyl-CoA thioester hydrolase